MTGTTRRIMGTTLAIVGLGAVVAGIIFLVRQDLDAADKIASVGGMVVGLCALGIGVWQGRQTSAGAGTTQTNNISGTVKMLVIGN